MIMPPREAAVALSAAAADLSAALEHEDADPLAPIRCLDRACDLVSALSWALCREPACSPLGGLAEIARNLAAELRADSQQADDQEIDAQARAISAQAGDLAVAYHSWAARGRRPGPLRDEVEGEVAHILLTTAIFAEIAGLDIDKAIGWKLALTAARDT
jgi:hypothetical protein